MSYDGPLDLLSRQFLSSPRSDVVDTATSVRTPITATGNATPFADGTYVEIDPSLSGDVAGIFIAVTSSVSGAGANSSTVLEIATGAGGSEVAWATVAVGYTNGSRQTYVPGFIASGTRVAVRVRSNVTVQAVVAEYTFLTPKATVPGAPVTMGGASIATTARGVTVTAPGSLNTKGAWTEIISSTSAAFGNLMVGPQGAAGTNMNGSGVLVDIGIGASSSETVLIGDIYLLGNASELYTARSPLTYGAQIPVGSRLSARYARANSGNAVDLILVGA